MAEEFSMSNDQLKGIYRMMNVIRKFEEKALYLFESNKLRGSVHLCIGQEAIPATVCSLLNPGHLEQHLAQLISE